MTKLCEMACDGCSGSLSLATHSHSLAQKKGGEGGVIVIVTYAPHAPLLFNVCSTFVQRALSCQNQRNVFVDTRLVCAERLASALADEQSAASQQIARFLSTEGLLVEHRHDNLALL
jgi:hypothetical protein